MHLKVRVSGIVRRAHPGFAVRADAVARTRGITARSSFPADAGAFLRHRDRPAEDLRRPGGDRDRERAAVQARPRKRSSGSGERATCWAQSASSISDTQPVFERDPRELRAPVRRPHGRHQASLGRRTDCCIWAPTVARATERSRTFPLPADDGSGSGGGHRARTRRALPATSNATPRCSRPRATAAAHSASSR